MVSSQPSFAAAASGAASRTGRADGSRKILRKPNASTDQSSQADSVYQTSNADFQDAQPSTIASQETSSDPRYSKYQLLDLFRAQQEVDAPHGSVSRLFTGSWDPGHSNGSNGRGWGKAHDARENHGPTTCWDANGSVQPIGLDEMSEAERTAFASDVNSPIKPPPQNLTKESIMQGNSNGRKTSISQSQNNFNLSSPASSRPTTARRQQTSDSITGLGSPATTGRFFRDEASPLLTRRPTDLKDSSDDHSTKNGSPFGGLMRSNTGGVLGNGPSSPWSAAPASATMSPMGNFGSFALQGTSTTQPPSSDKRPAYASMRGESRFAQMMSKESTEDLSSKNAGGTWRSRARPDTDPFGDDAPSGSAALGGGHDDSPPSNPLCRGQGLDTPTRVVSHDFGMSEMPGFRGQSHQTPQGHHAEHDSMSPSDTNPYRSPPEERNDRDDESYDDEPLHPARGQGLGGIPEHAQNSFGIPRTFSGAQFDGSDRSQTSSAGLPKAFPSLGLSTLGGGLGSMGGWPTSANPIGTPDRENRPGFSGAFGNSLFSPMGDLQSPGLGGGLGGIFGQPGNTVGRGSKLGSLFPPAMQAQMQGTENESSADGGDMRSSGNFGAIGRNAFASARQTDSPLRTGRGVFDEMIPQSETPRHQASFTSADGPQALTSTSFAQASTPAQTGFESSNQLPTVQQRTMVMPDRMRWVYLDPHGQVQGPWSGLEMHDWYKASFFTADLSVRKLEDTEFEPLGQMIRRIGNSREPFLVPSIGIQHGPPSTQAVTAYTPTAATPGNGAQPGSVLPPFAGAFPSFGTTLTAEQQNNLERRKQEEQYLMARQREFLAQQQVNMRQLQQTSGIPSSLHHQGSAGSLHSQPSFGSMTSPLGISQQAPIPGFFDASRQAPSQPTGGMPQDYFREEDLASLSLQERQELFGASAPVSQPSHAQPSSMFGQQSDQQSQMGRAEQLHQNEPSFNARLHEFNQLRAQHDLEEAGQSLINEPIGPPPSQPTHVQEPQSAPEEEESQPEAPEVLSLTQQVQAAASAKQSPTPATQPESPWAKLNTSSMPMPFPPPPTSTTPLPAPTAQRGRSNLPEALNVGVRSRSETPETAAATPSVAPWAAQAVEAPKKPSLKEIQELEAKQAAKLEEQAAAARRLQLEQERKMLASQPAAPAPGLPTTSTWGNTASPATPVTPSPWGASAAKAPVPGISAASKKTLSDIQREEEARKKRAQVAAAAAQPVATLAGGKRYADLAGKPTAAVPALGGSWSTVGAGGKVKIPTGPATTVPQAARAVSTATAPTVASRVARPAPAVRSVTAGQGANAAKEEFNRWAKATLSKGLPASVDIDNFISMISEFPEEAIADAVYSSTSMGMDGRHFAEEFTRRRKLAEKGVVEPSNSGSGSGATSAGGWNEVAKKGPPKEDTSLVGFKVANKKKGKK